MISLKEPDLCRNQRRTWSDAVIDFLSYLLDVPGDLEELLFQGVIIVVIVLVALIGGVLES
jgi:hypothetical protein